MGISASKFVASAFVAGKSLNVAAVHGIKSDFHVPQLMADVLETFKNGSLAGVSPDGFDLYHVIDLSLTPQTFVASDVDSYVAGGRIKKITDDGKKLSEIGLPSGARIVAVLPEVAAGGSGVAEAAAGKTITLRTFKKGKFEPKLQEVRSQEHLEHLLQRVQAEGLVDMASEVEVDQWHKIIPGGSYVFSGGIYNALNENRFWSQQMDLQLERDAVAALLRKGDEYGPLTEYTGSIDNVLEIKDDDGKKKRQQFDGIVLNSSAVLITEVKRVADIAHVSDLEEDVVFMQKFLKQTNIPAFKGIGSNAKVIPFYTAGCIKPSEEKYFLDRGINVIRPNGLQLSVVTTPHPFIIRKTSKGIRAFHSFASAVRKILK